MTNLSQEKPHLMGLFCFVFKRNITSLLFLCELHSYHLNHKGLISVICSVTTTTKNEKFIQTGNSSELGCHGSDANGECPGLHQATSSVAWKHDRQELQEGGHERNSQGAATVQAACEVAIIGLTKA